MLLVLPCKFRFEDEREGFQKEITRLELEIKEISASREVEQQIIKNYEIELASLREDLKKKLEEENNMLKQFVL